MQGLKQILTGLLEHPLAYNVSALLTKGRTIENRAHIEGKLAFEASDRTLDVCCGPGGFVPMVKGTYVGIDMNAQYLRYAGARFRASPHVHFCRSDAGRLCFRDKSFDKTVLVGALHHFSDPEALRMIREVRRVTKGTVIVIEPAPETSRPISRLLIALDRGDYIRPLGECLAILEQELTVLEHFTFYSGMASRRMLICRAP